MKARDVIEWRWENFNLGEPGVGGLDEWFLDDLQLLRCEYGRPMVISSGYRTPEHNARVSSTGPEGPHTTGLAVDVVVAGEDAYLLVQLAIKHGFTGIGLRQHGGWGKRFVHLDKIPLGGRHPRPRVWTYS